MNIPLIIIFLLTLFYFTFLMKIYAGLGKLKFSENIFPYNFNYVSVIIPFRNEEKNIELNIKSIQKQRFDENKFEVIYVNDNSDDNSVSILKEKIKNKNIRILNISNSGALTGHKKRAINYGINNSRGDIIVTTDADCTYTPEWLTTLVSCFEKDTGFVSGPVEFISGSGFWNKIQRLEFAGLIITGAGLIGANKPVICNAANLAFRKDAFLKVNGYKDNLNISSGDDEFLMQKIHKLTGYKIKFCASKRAKVYTNAADSLTEFYNQRKRWASKGIFYFDKLLVVKLVLIYLFYLCLFVQPVLGFFNPVFFVTFAVSFLIKFITEYLIIRKGNKLLYDYKFTGDFFIAEILHVPYILLAGFAGLFGNYNWKNRKVKR